RKFQLIQATYISHMFREAFLRGNLSRAEKRAARLAFGYALAHTVALAGLQGTPVWALAAWLYSLSGDDEDPADLSVDVRHLLGGGDMADAVMRGVPASLGVDISGNVGMRDVFDPLGPFSSWKIRGQQDGDKIILNLLGPTVGQAEMWFRAMGYWRKGDTLRAVESAMPKGVANFLRAERMARAGIPGQRDDMWLSPEEIDFSDQVAMALGFRTLKEAQAQEARQRDYDLKEAWKTKTANIKNRYVAAWREQDYARLADLREEWAALQDVKKKHGAKPSPLSNLLKAPQEN
ncbi:MAG: PLxRFG domain-containing protein, partial [Zoogloeaceae bacterium]|nr:PLxRFG domain-containing protein [Zoogloeaceae bacterium]